MDKSMLEKFFRDELTGREREDAVRFLSNPENELLVRHWLKENWDRISQQDTGEHHQHTDKHLQDPDAFKAWLIIQGRISANEGIVSKHLEDQSSPIQAKSISKHRSILHSNRFRAAAAAILVFMITGVTLFLNKQRKTINQAQKSDYTSPVASTDVAPPNASKAVLTLANGQEIFLDSSGNGTLASQGNMRIVKTKDGEIIYKGYETSQISYNTLSLPKGSKPVRLALADGSIVWLNAASSVTYPTAFNGTERQVSITGEAYFEVAKMEGQPFVVTHDGVSVKVLGTHFNVNTYPDETDIKVTLLEGSVDVNGRGEHTILQPGQQASVSSRNTRVSDAVDLDEVMAWKNGQFYFGGTNIKTIMRQIEKYYDVEVSYRDDVSYEFVAKISRQVNVSEFLEKLELTGLVHFNIEGKKITVSR